MECLERVISPVLFEEKASNDSEEAIDEHKETLARCLPECEHFDYPLEVALGKLSLNVPISGTSFFDNIPLENRSVVNVFFNDLVATRYRRDVYLNWQNVLAAFGGLLSLMLGFTLISGFDFILFFFFRVICDSISRYFYSDEEVYHSAIVGPKAFIINIEEHKRDNWVKKTKRAKLQEEMEKITKSKLISYKNRY